MLLSSLSSLEKKSLENFLQMSGGNVSNFSVRQLNEFVEECTGTDLDHQRFKADGESKARRLRAFWKSEPDPVVGKLLTYLIDYVLMPENQPTEELKTMEGRCRQIANRLLLGAATSSANFIVNLEPVGQTIFVNYRRDDASAEAHMVRDTLRRLVGHDAVFMDVTSIHAGAKWPDTIRQHLDKADTVVVVIGPNWLNAGMADCGRRRIDDETDWVRRELETALQSGKRVIPLRVRGARVPSEGELPESLRELFKRQSIEIRRDVWDHDIKQLEAALAVPRAAVTPSAPTPNHGSQSFERSPANIKRERDVKQLQEVFQWLSLGAMDRFLHWMGHNGWLTNEGYFLWERLGWLIDSSRFYLSDGELRTLLVNFMKAWGKCFTHYEHMAQHRNGKMYFFNVHDGDEAKYIREQNQRAKFNRDQIAPLKAAWDTFLDYVRENYTLEIDLETAGEAGLKEYREEEAQLLELIRVTEQADRYQ